MKTVAFFASTLLVAIGLTGCGGGASSPQNATLYRLIPNALPVIYPQEANSAFSVTALDVNSDGKDDLVVHYIGTNKYWNMSVGNITAPNAIRVYIQQADGAFKDQTETHLIGTDNIGGWSRKFKTIDINNDGKLDVIFGVNQEDGRVQSIASDMNAQMAALVSVEDKYKIIKFGTPNWYESIGIGYDIDNNIFVTGNGHSTNNTTSFYVNKNGEAIETGLELPFISAVAFEFMKPELGSKFKNILIQPNDADYWKHLYMQGFTQALDGSWLSLPMLTSIAQRVGTASYTGYLGGSSDVPIWLVDGKYFTGGYVDSCQLKISPSENNTSIFAIGGLSIKNYQPGMQLIGEELEHFHSLKGIAIKDGQLIEVPLNIKNEQKINVNSNFMECRDVNGDGYDDIIVYRYIQGWRLNETYEYMHLYLNTRNGGFNYIDQSNFPKFLQSGYSSYFHDFDGDGIYDLIIYPSATTSTSWFYYRGLKSLN